MADSIAPSSAADIAASALDARAIEVASQLFLRDGIEAVRMTDIATAAGVGVATLYRHFSTKTALAMAAATLMWENLLTAYDQLASSSSYQLMSGAERLRSLLDTFCNHSEDRLGFAAFIDELDRLILAGDADAAAISAYATRLNAAYPHYEAAYQLGRADGSIAREVDFWLFYRSVAHAIMSMSSKLSRGEVLPSDDFSAARAELDCIIDLAIRSLT